MLLLTTRVSAAGEEARPTARKPRLRAVTVSGRVEEVRVAARTATRIRFDTAVDAARTRLEDGQGRFEPLLLGNGFLVVTPREELPADERVTLDVVLSDGTHVPFVLAAGATEVDVQVRVSRHGPAAAPTLVETPTVVSAVWREREHALGTPRAEWPERPRSQQGEGRAGRLAESMLVLAARSEPRPPEPGWHAGAGPEVERRLFHVGVLSGFVVRVRNPEPLRSWEPGQVRVRQEGGGEVEVLALRMGPEPLPPGGWGWLVVVTRALPRDGQARFELELRGRGGASEAPPEGVAL
ncbi:DUF2381 family protein [Archangium sp.]|uniref:DUF2381 family protein n=1 Tax=Archangium sp. TaxID=1872627 RepID=UPI00389B2D44